MRKFAIIPWLLVFLILATARFAGSALILTSVSSPYSTRIINALGVLMAGAAALLLDRLVRAFYWDGYLRRRRGRETPVVIQILLTIALVALGVSVGLYFEAGVSFAGLLTASGATALILGIALQAGISDVFSGVSVNLNGSVGIGDWLTIYSAKFSNPVFGRVQSIALRSTFLRLADGRRLMIPNHILTSNPVINHSRPQGAKRLFVEIPIARYFPAERAIGILLAEAYRAVRTKPLSAQRNPEVLIDRFGPNATFLHVRFYADLEETEPQIAKSIMAVALHRALQRHGVPEPAKLMEFATPRGGSRDAADEVREALARVPIFENILGAAELETLVSSCSVRSIPAGSTFIRQGEAGKSMFVLLDGAAHVSIAMPDGEKREVAVLASGDIVGEMSLMTGAPRTTSVTSLTAMRFLEVTNESMELLLAAEPGLLERFSHVLAARQSHLSEIASTMGQKRTLERDILAQIRKFFSRTFG
ncbi:MAG TPA: mechanosensitive ion channel family protein [Rhizomicrobium sp.]|nr:mechanosensitive ion channel family protein [Rhizomicrobium sp.]